MNVSQLNRVWTFCTLALVLLCLPSFTLAQPEGQETSERPGSRDPRIDPATGKDRRVWPPDVLFQHRSFALDMVIPDMSKHEFRATARIVVSPIAQSRARIELDAGPALTFSAVRINGQAAPSFAHDAENHKLTIKFPRSVDPSEQVTIEMDYTAVKPGGRGNALTWSSDDRRTPEVDYMLHAQGEPENNHLWFPCHDFPNLRVPTELSVTVQEPYEAVSNGRLVAVERRSFESLGLQPPAPAARTKASDDDETTVEASPTHLRRFHWKQDLPHTYYLVTLIVSRFDVANVGGPRSEYPGLWMPVYGPLGSEDALKRAFGNTPAMIAHFDKLFDFKYPWDKYAQILCRDFAAGAMENTSAVTFQASLVRGGGRRGSIDEIISHELVHHWFGDLITCRSWEHLWIQEGWATMGEALWAEKQRGEDGYQAAMLRNFERERVSSRNRSAPSRVGMVSNIYRNPDSRFTSADNVYSKGGAVLHMLRMRLGDDVFFQGVRSFLKEHQYSQVETDDFRFAMERASGQSLERFFDQWCKRPGHPSLEVDYVYADHENGGRLTITVEQTQHIDADNPAFAFVLPVWVQLTDDDGVWASVVMDSRTASTTLNLAHKPLDVEVDPYLNVLCRTRVRQPLASLIRQAEHGRTFAIRARALEQLAESSTPRATLLLARLTLKDVLNRRSYVDDPDHALAARASAALSTQIASLSAGARTVAARLYHTHLTHSMSDRLPGAISP